MALINIKNLTIGFRGPPLLDDVTCQIERGDRIGLLGRNGAGKSTLLKVIAGVLAPDHGVCEAATGVVISQLPQEVPQELRGKISQVIASAENARRNDEQGDWQREQRTKRVLEEMSLDGEAEFSTLSAGMKRRVLLARALVDAPDVLLLDEPTNHLDIQSIDWLEAFLGRWRGTLIFVTHDRAFLRRLARRIIEIDRGRLFDWSCDYEAFLTRKEQALAAEEQQNAEFDRRLAEEEAWIRQGVKARRTRNEGRVRRLEQMRVERSERREKTGPARIAIQEAPRSGRLVIEAKEVSFAFGDRMIVDGFSTSIMRGDKVGLIGPNGVGKTTLLRILLGELAPQQGRVRQGSNLEIAYFDQLRGQLDGDATVEENVGEGRQSVVVNGKSRHVLGYLQDFLFPPDRARMQVKFLSGGERNRIVLAKLFAKPANVLVLDEPTNDLDAETLELLEERVCDFDGAVLVVSHDRAFLNNVVTSVIVFEDLGVREYFGGYDDWVRQRNQRSDETSTNSSGRGAARASVAAIPDVKTPPKKKLSFKERRELETLPGEIERLESELAEVHAAMAAPSFYQQSAAAIALQTEQAQTTQAKLDKAFARWEELEALRSE